ncbi:Aste57867_25129 [Aphanomyces stellatus]|uniref:Mannosyltransferase n=1 Tax=Aphanomyces stellatus TaxID=120398 RepID=A0A485LWV0_9STRA|nr:hypothetical protein As57867_025051 [Aphanomyces stellatus]VFU01760.1 Aste57867_25129 [Aphanomyces stellatus]
MWKVFLALVLFRVANALFVRTYFNPDEFWQSSEVAHRMVFGYGYLTWEWLPHAQLRGYAHPAVFALLYKALQNLDSPWAVAYSPRILQGILTAVTDFSMFRLARVYFDASVANYALFCQLTSWFTFFALSRTFSNSIETCCTTLALSYWPWAHLVTDQTKRRTPSNVERRQQRLAFAYAALGCIFRPTNAVLWVFLATALLVRTPFKVDLVVGTILPIGAAAIAIMLVVDRIGYGEWTCVPLNFVTFNVLEGKDALYGTHPWYWYFVAGYPEITATALPFIVYGVMRSTKRELGAVVLWALVVYSAGAHKEPRFLLPLLPASFVYAGKGLDALQAKRFFNALLVCLALVNGAAAVYFARIHQAAPLDVMDFLAARLADRPNASIDLFLPCHATPLYSHLHHNVPIWFPTCAPEERERGSPSDALRADPAAFARRRYVDNAAPLPTYLVMYSSSAAALADQLTGWKFSLAATFAHSTISMDADVSVPDTHMLVFVRDDESTT